MLKLLLRALHISEGPSKRALRVIGSLVLLLTLVQGTMVAGETYTLAMDNGDSQLFAVGMVALDFLLFGVLFGFVAILLMVLIYGPIRRIIILTPIAIRGTIDAAQSIWRGIGSLVRFLIRIPSVVKAMTAADWSKAAFYTVSFAMFGVVAYFMWPFAVGLTAKFPWMLHDDTFMGSLVVDVFLSSLVWAVLMVVFALAITFVRVLGRRN
jgi:hypothetical protein